MVVNISDQEISHFKDSPDSVEKSADLTTVSWSHFGCPLGSQQPQPPAPQPCLPVLLCALLVQPLGVFTWSPSTLTGPAPGREAAALREQTH